MHRVVIVLLVLLGGCVHGPKPEMPYRDLDSDAVVAELASSDSASLCHLGWEWVVAQTGRHYSLTFCANHLSGYTWPSRQECERAMEGCIARFPLADVATDVCSRAFDESGECPAMIGDLQACFRDISLGYAESGSKYDCTWLTGRDRAGSPVPTPESCTRLPRGCRRLLGFGG